MVTRHRRHAGEWSAPCGHGHVEDKPVMREYDDLRLRVFAHQHLLDQPVGDGVDDGEHPPYTGVDSFGPGCNRCPAKSQTQEGHAMTHSRQTSFGVRGVVFASFLL